MISQEISKKTAFVPERRKMLVCVGGTARAALKLAKKRYHLSEDCRSIKVKQLEELCGYLRSADREALDLLLKLEPDRVHTIVPGMMILLHIAKLFQSKEIMVSHYGVREGYLCHKNWGEYEN